MKNKLNRCPFCDSDKISICGNYIDKFQVGCMFCHIGTDKEGSRKKAIEKWNTRAPSKDRELLIELSLPGKSLLKGNRYDPFFESKEIALKIRKHLDENP